jgi:hypothetical protein
MTKLVEQIVSEHLHLIAERIEQDPAFLKQSTNENVAGALLCAIAHDAHPGFVIKALAALGVANSLDEVGQRLTAVREARTSAFESAGIDIIAEHAARQRASDEAAVKVFEALRGGLGALFATPVAASEVRANTTAAPNDEAPTVSTEPAAATPSAEPDPAPAAAPVDAAA